MAFLLGVKRFGFRSCVPRFRIPASSFGLQGLGLALVLVDGSSA